MTDRGKIADHWENNGLISISGFGQLAKEMENNTFGSWPRLGSLEAEPEMGILVQVTYWGSVFMNMGSGETTVQGRGEISKSVVWADD